MPETTVTLDPENRAELSRIITEFVFSEIPTPEFVDAFIEREPDLVEEGVKWGFCDTVVRETIAERCSEWLIDRSWPRYGDNLSDEQFLKFDEDLKNAYTEWVAESRK